MVVQSYISEVVHFSIHFPVQAFQIFLVVPAHPLAPFPILNLSVIRLFPAQKPYLSLCPPLRSPRRAVSPGFPALIRNRRYSERFNNATKKIMSEKISKIISPNTYNGSSLYDRYLEYSTKDLKASSH